jgi:hypothetical protein
MRAAFAYCSRNIDSRNMVTLALLIALALMTCFNLVQAHVIRLQREEVRSSVASDFLYLSMLVRERNHTQSAQSKKAGPAAPPQSK